MTEIVTTKHPHAADMGGFPPRLGAEILAGYRRFYEAGVPEALHMAMYFCREAVGCPDWVSDGAYEVVSRYLRGEKYTKKRIIHGEARKIRTIRAEYIRWRLVVGLEATGLPLEEAYEAAVDLLLSRGTYKVSSSSVRASYKRVSKELKDEKTARQYFFSTPPIHEPLTNLTHLDWEVD